MIEQPHHPHLTVLPATVAGRWSVVLAVVSLVAIVRSGERGILLALLVLWGPVVTFQALGELLWPH
jgi:hypothetical protein